MDSLPDTNESLLGRVKNPADHAAWSEFLAIYRPVVLRMAGRRGLQPADADDLAQSVFIAVAGAIRDWEPRSDGPPFRAWLFRIARNAIINSLESRKRHQAPGGTSMIELLREVPQCESTAEFVRESRSELFRHVASLVRNEFSPAIWNLFWRTAVEGHDCETVAAESKRTVGSVYVAKWRVLKRIKEKASELSAGWE